jgi:stringent starvation protein B
MLSKKPYLLRAHYDWIIDSNWTPYLLVNAGYQDVHVPTQYVRDGRIVLDISPRACRDLKIGLDGVQFSARFSGQVWHIKLPLPSILAIYAKENSQGMTFPVEDALPEEKTIGTSEDAVVKKPFLTVISNDERSRN